MNRKGGAMDVILFLVAIMLVTGLWMTMQKSAAMTKVSMSLSEKQRVATLLAKGLINYEDCMGTGEHGVIEESSIDDTLTKSCVKKLPYVYGYIVFKSGGNEVGDGYQSASDCVEDPDRGNIETAVEPVMIRKSDDNFYPGLLQVWVASVDYDFSQKITTKSSGGGNYEVTLGKTTIGMSPDANCLTDFEVTISCIEDDGTACSVSETFEISESDFNDDWEAEKSAGDTWGGLSRNDTIEVEIKPRDMDATTGKIKRYPVK